MNLGNTFFIVSVYQNGLTEAVNLSNNVTVYQALVESGLQFKAGKGSYKGVKELNFIVYGLNNENVVKEIARNFNQESYLIVYQDMAAEIFTIAGIGGAVGTFTAVPETEAISQEAWTLVDSQYYICK